jgi:pyrroline-5-carboxylate reductase
MPTPSKVMRQWLDKATPAQKKIVAVAAGTSVAHLQHIAGGRRKVEAGLAQSIAAASKLLHKKALLIDARTLCEACGTCPLVDKRKAPIVDTAA